MEDILPSVKDDQYRSYNLVHSVDCIGAIRWEYSESFRMGVAVHSPSPIMGVIPFPIHRPLLWSSMSSDDITNLQSVQTVFFEMQTRDQTLIGVESR